MRKKDKNMDWATNGLFILACLVIVLLGMNFFKSDIEIPKHEVVSNWENLLKPSSLKEGDPTASVKLIEFYSYSCGYCKVFSHSLSRIRKKYPENVEVYYEPIHMGKFGFDFMTAVAAHCADDQDSFSVTNKLLYEYEGSIPSWDKLAQRAFIPNSKQFINCVENRDTRLLVQRDEKISADLGIPGVPYIIVNGKGFLGSLAYTQLEAIIERELE